MRLRSHIFAALFASPHPLGAYDIALQIAAKTGKRCHANSIYRCLSAMIEGDEVQQIVSVNRFALTVSGRVSTIWLICSQCKSAMGTGGHGLNNRLDQITALQRFKPSRQFIEVIGICADCANVNRPQQGLTL